MRLEKCQINPTELTRKNTSVFVIDMQHTYLQNIPEQRRGALVNNIENILSTCIKKDIPTAIINKNGGGKMIKPLKEISAKIPRVAEFKKPSLSGFDNQYLLPKLEEWETESVFLTGIYSGGCVRITAEDAIHHGKKIATALDVLESPCHKIEELDRYWYDWNGLLLPSYEDLPLFNRISKQ